MFRIKPAGIPLAERRARSLALCFGKRSTARGKKDRSYLAAGWTSYHEKQTIHSRRSGRTFRVGRGGDAAFCRSTSGGPSQGQ